MTGGTYPQEVKCSPPLKNLRCPSCVGVWNNSDRNITEFGDLKNTISLNYNFRLLFLAIKK